MERGGEPGLADALADALAAAQREADAGGEPDPRISHVPGAHAPGHRAPPDRAAGRAGATVLDPFCGSGTTLVEARAAGMSAVGIDLNPLAVLIARAKNLDRGAGAAPGGAVGRSRDRGGGHGGGEGGAAGRLGGVASAALRADPAGRDRAVGEWFAPHVRRELETLAGRSTRRASATTRPATCCARCCRRSSTRCRGARPIRTRAGGEADRARRGDASVRPPARAAVRRARGSGRARGPLPRVVCTDARRIGGHVTARSADLVLTSPPYAGTYDYADQHRLQDDLPRPRPARAGAR